MTAHFRAATFGMIRPAMSTIAQAESGSGPVVLCTRARHFCIASVSSTATFAHSNRNAAQRKPSRRIPRDIHEHARYIARSLTDTESFEQSRHERKKIEMRFAHLKRILKLGRLRLRGPRGAQDEFVLAVIAQNLRRLASLVARPPPDAAPCIA
jgi:hypothetical protein